MKINFLYSTRAKARFLASVLAFPPLPSAILEAGRWPRRQMVGGWRRGRAAEGSTRPGGGFHRPAFNPKPGFHSGTLPWSLPAPPPWVFSPRWLPRERYCSSGSCLKEEKHPQAWLFAFFTPGEARVEQDMEHGPAGSILHDPSPLWSPLYIRHWAEQPRWVPAPKTQPLTPIDLLA